MIDIWTNGTERIRHLYANKMSVDIDLIAYTKINSDNGLRSKIKTT